MNGTVLKILTAPDNLIRNCIDKLARNRIKTDSFSLIESITYSWRIDVWQRYSCIVEEIKMMGDDCKSVLDVGGSGGSIINFTKLFGQY